MAQHALAVRFPDAVALAEPAEGVAAVEDQGKSGSARIIYVDFEIGEKICGLAAYPKSEKANLTEKEKQAIKKLIDTIEPYYNTPDGKEK